MSSPKASAFFSKKRTVFPATGSVSFSDLSFASPSPVSILLPTLLPPSFPSQIDFRRPHSIIESRPYPNLSTPPSGLNNSASSLLLPYAHQHFPSLSPPLLVRYLASRKRRPEAFDFPSHDDRIYPPFHGAPVDPLCSSFVAIPFAFDTFHFTSSFSAPLDLSPSNVDTSQCPSDFHLRQFCRTPSPPPASYSTSHMMLATVTTPSLNQTSCNCQLQGTTPK
eukprot:g8630.t1